MGIKCIFTWAIGLIVSKHDRQRIQGSMNCADVLTDAPLVVGTERFEGACRAEVTLERNDDLTQTVGLHVSFSSDCPKIHLESWHLDVSIPDESEAAAFDPTGFGAAKRYRFDAWYPAMQFSALFSPGGCTYLGVHDGRAFPKTFKFDGNRTIQAEYLASSEMEPMTSLPFKIQVIEGTCSWTDMADLYKVFARNTDWYKRGLSVRMSRPEWMYSVPLWINTHWQTLDVFEITGGKPSVVLERVKRFKDLVGDVPMMLHWYEWDKLGYSDSDYTDCPTGAVCGFDSHYPEYFPPREGFEKVVSELAEMNVHTIPYINGRIFDQSLDQWNHDFVQEAAVRGKSHQFVVEEYGNSVKFAAMCPATQFWQQTIADVAQGVVETSSSSGVYIDQISAAPPLHCYNKNHSHAHGGGSSWASGYNAMLAQVRKQVGSSRLVVTESNAEQFIGSVDIFLSLIAMFDVDGVIPAFQYVYPGGVFVSAGAEFYQSDVVNNEGIGFMKKLMKQFILGSQLGWFSLGGRDNQVPPMGLLDLLLDSKYEGLVHALKRLIKARTDPHIWRVFAYGGLVGDLGSEGWIWADSKSGLAIFCNPRPETSLVYMRADLTDKISPDVVDMYSYSDGDWTLIGQGQKVNDIEFNVIMEPRSCAIVRLEPTSFIDVIPEVSEI